MGSRFSKLRHSRRRPPEDYTIEPEYTHYAIYKKTWRKRHLVKTMSNKQDVILEVSADPSMSYREFKGPNREPVMIRPVSEADTVSVSPPIPVRRSKSTPKIQLTPRRKKTRSMPYLK